MPEISSLASSAADPLAVALGYVNCSPGFLNPGSNSAPTSQTIFATGIYLPFSKTITSVVVNVVVAGVGTSPTGFFAGVASPAKMLAQSANIIGGGSEGQLKAIGTAVFPLSAAYVPTAADSPSGLFYLVVLLNGSYASTNVQFGKAAVGTGVGTGAALSGQSPWFATLGTGQTALPANTAAITLSTSVSSNYWGMAAA